MSGLKIRDLIHIDLKHIQMAVDLPHQFCFIYLIQKQLSNN